MRFADLFAGIGCFSLGLEAAGMTCAGHCEIDPGCQEVLEFWWPGLPLITDVAEIQGHEFGKVDLLALSPPCQPISLAGKRKGASDPRWLWGEALEACRRINPRWVVCENPPGIKSMGLSGVLLEMEASGFEVPRLVDGSPLVFDLPACGVGAAHLRHRIFIVAHSQKQRGGEEPSRPRGEQRPDDFGGQGGDGSASDPGQVRRGEGVGGVQKGQLHGLGAGEGVDGGGGHVGPRHPGRQGPQERQVEKAQPGDLRDQGEAASQAGVGNDGRGRDERSPHPQGQGRQPEPGSLQEVRAKNGFGGTSQLSSSIFQDHDHGGPCFWVRVVEPSGKVRYKRLPAKDPSPEPGLLGVADGTPGLVLGTALDSRIPLCEEGVPQRTAKLKAIGNAVYWPLVREIGLAIMEADEKWGK